jgi:ribosomal protein L12E/L44/L45/RPP1/RPP2
VPAAPAPTGAQIELMDYRAQAMQLAAKLNAAAEAADDDDDDDDDNNDNNDKNNDKDEEDDKDDNNVCVSIFDQNLYFF